VAKRRRHATFDAGGERLLELGLSYTASGWHAEALQFRCFRNPVTVSLAGGRSGIHPAQLEALERVVAERTYALNDMAIRAAYDEVADWYSRYAVGKRCPSKRWVGVHTRVGEIYFPAPSKKARGTLPPQFGLFASHSPDDGHAVHVYCIWTGEGWLGTRDSGRTVRRT
jgi:hypothetical protein